RHAADARHNAGSRHLVVVHSERCQGRQFEERRSVVEERVDSFADRQLSLFAMTLKILLAASLPRVRDPVAELRDEMRHPLLIDLEEGGGGADVAVERFHYQPQQSLLNPQAEHRQTACMRYISAPQRSHNILSSPLPGAGAVVFRGWMGEAGGCGGG